MKTADACDHRHGVCSSVNASSISVHMALPDLSYTLVWWKQDRSFLVIKSSFKSVKVEGHGQDGRKKHGFQL